MTADQPRTKAEWAQYYVQWGWRIFPVWWIGEDGECACPGAPILDEDGNVQLDKDGRVRKANCRPGKHPIPKKGLHAAVNDPQIIQTWWTTYPEANIGLATGEETGLVVVDADGPEAIAAVEALDLPATVTAQSGSGEGMHFFFLHPGEVKLPNWSRRHDDLPGVDFRGDGGYVLMTPSNHHSGNRYAWIEGPKAAKFASLPEAFIERYCLPKAASKSAGAGGDDNPDDDPEYVNEGRNIYLTRKAGYLRRAGLDETGLLQGLRSLNEQRCRPPLPDEEVVRIAANIAKKPTGDPGPPSQAPSSALGDALARHANTLPPILAGAALNDQGNAECCDALHPNEFRFCIDKGKGGTWFWWTGNYWQEDKGARAERAMMATIIKRQEAALLLPKKSDRARLLKHCEQSLNIGKIRSALASLSTFEGIRLSVADFDHNPDLLGTQNGAVDLRTGAVRPGRQEDLISRVASVAYDPQATAPRWERFVSEIMGGDPDLTAYLQRVIGYSLTGSIKEQVFFIFYGLGANGKSTFLSVLGQLLGDYAAIASFDSFDADNRSSASNDLARLRAVRLVSCIESEHNRKLAEGRVKSITGGEPISCRFLFAEHFEYVPQFKIILAVNHRPIIRGSDQGIWRRVQLVPFEQSFVGRADLSLGDTLLTELPGIFNWALRGLGEWRRLGLNPPAQVKQAVEEYRQESDQLNRWLEEAVELDKNERAHAGTVYQAYRSWSIENGERPLSNPQLTQRLKEKGIETVKGRGGLQYKGFKLLLKEVNLGGFGNGTFRTYDEAAG